MFQRGYQPMGSGSVGSVEVNDSGLFDSAKHTQGGVSHLIQLLWDAYLAHLSDVISRRTMAGKASVPLSEAIRRAPATDFAKFCADYLAVNRPTQSFFIDENMGILLSNQTSVALSPGVEIRGTMQNASAVQVTEGLSQQGLNGVKPEDNISLRI